MKDPKTKPVTEITDIQGIKSQYELWKNKAEKPGCIAAALAIR